MGSREKRGKKIPFSVYNQDRFKMYKIIENSLYFDYVISNILYQFR